MIHHDSLGLLDHLLIISNTAICCDLLWALAGGGWHRRLCHLQPFSRWCHPCTARWHRGEHTAAHLATAGLWGWTNSDIHCQSPFCEERKKSVRPKSNIFTTHNMKLQEKWSSHWSVNQIPLNAGPFPELCSSGLSPAASLLSGGQGEGPRR